LPVYPSVLGSGDIWNLGFSNTERSLCCVTNAVGVKADIPVANRGDFILKVGGMSFCY